MALILFIEDDGLLQADGEMMLIDAGYDVMLASSGADACSLLQRHCEQVSALVTDINLHGPMSGWQVAEAARRLNPALPVLYVSASEQADFPACGVAGSYWVSKPFEWSEVTQAIAAMVRA